MWRKVVCFGAGDVSAWQHVLAHTPRTCATPSRLSLRWQQQQVPVLRMAVHGNELSGARPFSPG